MKTIISPKTKIETGSAPAPGAVFRALAENLERSEKFLRFETARTPPSPIRGRTQPRPARPCSPTPAFGIKKHSWPAPVPRRFHAIPAFTLIELLVVIATLAVLSLVLLPALARSRAQPQVAACTANFRQWAVSVNVYANDHLDSLPRFDWPSGGGEFIDDVATNMVSDLAPYGLTVPNWFCPVRATEFDAAEANLGRPINTIQDLQASFDKNPYLEAIINHNWWVQRSGTYPSVALSSLFPPDYTTAAPLSQAQFLATHPWLLGTTLGIYGTPKKLHDSGAAHTPFISDKAGSSNYGQGLSAPLGGKTASTNPDTCAPNTAHFFNGVLFGVNAAYADGHVEAHSPSQMVCGYSQGDPYWFY